MLFSFSGLNWWAILVATLAGFMLGGLWYGPIFGKAWLRAIGKREEDLTNPAPAFAISFVTAFATALLLALLVGELGTVQTALDGGRDSGCLEVIERINLKQAGTAQLPGSSYHATINDSGREATFSHLFSRP